MYFRDKVQNLLNTFDLLLYLDVLASIHTYYILASHVDILLVI